MVVKRVFIFLLWKISFYIQLDLFFTKERWSQLSFENQVVLANFGEGHFLSLNCSLTVLGKIFCADVIWHRFWSNWGLLFEFQEWKKFRSHQIWYISKSLEKEPVFCFILEKRQNCQEKTYTHLLFQKSALFNCKCVAQW